MESNKQDEEPPQERAPWMLKRWANLSAQLECPKCGAGRLPQSRHCLHCGAELPPVHHEESPGAAERKRPSRRALNWLIDLVPGVASLKVVVASLAAFAAAGGVAALAVGVLPEGPSAIFLSAGFALLGLLLYLCGLGWLLHGKICYPLDALAGLRLKHWLLALVLLALAVRFVLWML